MGATLSCDCCQKDIPQGDGPNRTVPVWEDPTSKDMMHLCEHCYNPVFLVAMCKNPLAYTQRTAWDVLGKENARQLNAASTGPVREAAVGVRRVIDQTFWRHCKACGAESATGRRVDDDLCFFCREPLEPLDLPYGDNKLKLAAEPQAQGEGADEAVKRISKREEEGTASPRVIESAD